ncbi:MAG: adenylosuccinate lyase [Acidimicrobiales bacterium]|jgi:adenylosuccinate lyase
MGPNRDPSRDSGTSGNSGNSGNSGKPDELALTAREWRLRSLSPLDGRYGAQMGPYAASFSEGTLIRERFAVEVAWLEHLAALPDLTELQPLSARDHDALTQWVAEFGQAEAASVKSIEAVTNHDVKAVEYYLKRRLVQDLGWPAARTEFVHFAATSEDVNNLAYARMIRSALKGAWLPGAEALVETVRRAAVEYAALAMLARTHGQPATPTTVGKELAVFVARWERQLRAVSSVEVPGKWGGATGTLAAHVATYPELDWMAIAGDFVASMGFTWEPLTTQVEPHDWMAELFAAMSRFGTVLIDFCQDMWFYISLGYFRQRALANEVGSSVMPHKVNPIDFENAESNAGMAGAMFGHLSAKLPLSRMQRDLSDSSALRNIGSAFGYSALAVASARRGMARTTADAEALAADLDGAWEVLAEAVQTVMRRYGVPEPYERLKALTRGKVPTQADLQHFVRGLDLPAQAQQRLLDLTPQAYNGLAERLARLVERPS